MLGHLWVWRGTISPGTHDGIEHPDSIILKKQGMVLGSSDQSVQLFAPFLGLVHGVDYKIQTEQPGIVRSNGFVIRKRKTATPSGGRSLLITDHCNCLFYRSFLRQFTRSPSVVVELETGALCALSL